MKKLITILLSCLFFCAAPVSAANTDETVLPWEGSLSAGSNWGDQTYSWAASTFTNAKAGDIITVTVGGSGQYQLWIGGSNSDDSKYKMGKGSDGTYSDISSTTTETYTLTADQAGYLKSNGLMLNGHDVTYYAVHYYSATSMTILSSQSFDSNGSDQDLKNSVPTDLQAGDQIYFDISNTGEYAYADYKIKDGDTKTVLLENGSWQNNPLSVTSSNLADIKAYFHVWAKNLTMTVTSVRKSELYTANYVDTHLVPYNKYMKETYTGTANNITILYGGTDETNKTEWGKSAAEYINVGSSAFTSLNVIGSGATADEKALLPGDTLFVYMSHVGDGAIGRIYKGDQWWSQSETTEGENNGIVSKLGHFLVKGDYYFQVLDAKMVELIKDKGLNIGGNDYRVEFVTIHKGRRAITLSDPQINNRITTEKTSDSPYTLTSSSAGVTISGNTATLTTDALKNNTYTVYWGDRFLVTTANGTATTCTAKIYNGDDEVRSLTTAKTTQGYSFYLRHAEALDLYNDLKLVITVTGDNIQDIRLCYDSRRLESDWRDLNKYGYVDWGGENPTRIICSNLGNVHKNSQIRMTLSGSGQYAYQVMHYGETDTKGLYFNDEVRYAYTDIYDRVNYGDGGTEYETYNSNTTITYTIPTEAIADNILANTFIITGQNSVHVDKVEVMANAYNYPVSIPQGITSEQVSTYGTMQWAGLCAPYDLVVPHNDDIKAYVVTGKGELNKDTKLYPLTLKRVYNVKQGDCVLLKKSATDAAIVEFPLPCKEEGFAQSQDEKDAFAQNMLCGHVYSAKVSAEDSGYRNYALGYKTLKTGDTERTAAFYPIASGGKTIGAARIWLRVEKSQITNGAKGFSFTFSDDDDIPTGIDNVAPAEKPVDNNWYTLQGVRVQHPGKGIYIHNGKKIIR